MLLPRAFLQTINNSGRVLTFTYVIRVYKYTKLWVTNTLNLFLKHSVSPIPSNCLITKMHDGLLTVTKFKRQVRRGKHKTCT